MGWPRGAEGTPLGPHGENKRFFPPIPNPHLGEDWSCIGTSGGAGTRPEGCRKGMCWWHPAAAELALKGKELISLDELLRNLHLCCSHRAGVTKARPLEGAALLETVTHCLTAPNGLFLRGCFLFNTAEPSH